MNKQNRKRVIEQQTEWLLDRRGIEGLGETDEGIEKHRLVVTE